MRYWLVLILSLGLSACGGSGGSSSGQASFDASQYDAVYTLKFETMWNSTDFPTNYPSNAHFSGLIGATHNSQIKLWEAGSLASAGMISMAETGSKTALTSEVNSAKTAGTAEVLLSGNGVSSGEGSTTLEFPINQTHSLVSVVSMIAPSPDWFIGVNSLALYDAGQGGWQDEVVVLLKTYDAGSDGGLQYASANQSLSSKLPIVLLTSQAQDTDFAQGVQRASSKTIAKFTFTKK